MKDIFSSRNVHMMIFIIMIPFIIWILSTFYFHGEPGDRSTLCPGDNTELTGITVVLMDRTEDISDVQRLVLEKRFREMVADSRAGEKIIVYDIVGKSGLDVRPEIEVCNPGRGRVKFMPNVLDEKVYGELFAERLLDTFQRNLQISEQDNSPVMEIIQAAAGINFSGLHGSVPMRLIIVSDLMQHSGLYSQYTHRGEENGFFQSRVFEQVAVPLDGVDVEVWYLPRFSGPSAQPQGHREFWNHYFTAMNARSVIFNTVTGAGWGLASK